VARGLLISTGMNTVSHNHVDLAGERILGQPAAPVQLSVDALDPRIDVLHQLLADGLDLTSQVKQAHWTVRGPNFIAYHLLFDELAERLRAWNDEIAERCVTLAGTVHGTLRAAARSSALPDYPEEAMSGNGHVAALIVRYTAFAAALRAGLDEVSAHSGDAISQGLLAEILRGVELDLWKLSSHVD